MLKTPVFLLLICFLATACSEQQLPQLNYQLNEASVTTKGNQLIVSTGKVERIWEITEAGLSTLAFNDLVNGKNRAKANMASGADWEYFGLIDSQTKANLVELTANTSNDEQFTSEHIEIIAEFEYPDVESSVKYIIWAYPNAPGIRTQLFIKGEAEKYLNNPNLKQREDIQFDVVNGKNKNDYGAGTFAERYITTVVQDAKSVQFHAKGLDASKEYQLGFTWWNFSGKPSTQNVRITSVDGETKAKPIIDRELPNFKQDGKQFETILVDLPSEVLLDGTCRIFFDNIKGNKAQVSELFIYEKGERKIEIINGIPERIEQLKAAQPPGYSLIGYLDCGEAIQGDKMIASGRVDYLPVNTNSTTRTHIGYYNDTQHRNRPETPILKEVTTNKAITESEKENWTNIIRIDKDGSGIIMVKESHKCANQYGVETGEFILSDKGLENTGTSLFPSDINANEYKWCWASWSIAYSGNNDGAELAIKEFDRFRYPIDPKRDIYIQANTWGSGRNRDASQEANILLELETQADLGIDIQQIDDGWQTKNWELREDWYPKGWKNVVAKSKETGVKLGLWAAAMPVTYDALKSHFDEGGFETYKLDFASLGNHENMEALMGKIRKFVQYTDHKVRVNWDLTENAPRFGYFWAREYGCIYLENRKPDKPENVVYIPHLVLRDIWHVAKYTNINKFQTSIQNIEMTNRKVSDAYLHNHPYSVAIGLVGTPLFFQETHNYSESAKNQIRPLLANYKAHRNEMYDSYVFPIGDEPNNANWTGFQWYKSNRNTGYLMVFRELNNHDQEQQISLRFLKNKNIKISNLETKEIFNRKVDENGLIQLSINQPAGFLFLKYEIIN